MKSSYSQIYLDYNATTPCSEEVVTAMLPYFSEHYGNASSEHHAYGWLSKDALEEATKDIAKQLGIQPKEVIYTSGATEGINAILKGLFYKSRKERDHIITIKTAHKAMLDVCNFLEKEGASITYLDVDAEGHINLQSLKESITERTLVVAVLYGNNETGVLQPLDSISEICRTSNCPLFVDGTQTLGKIPLDDFFSKVDFACFSAHKLYGPKGVGFNYISEEKQGLLDGLIHGGGQQRGMRGGTYNVPLIVGMAKAVELAIQNLKVEQQRLKQLRDLLELELSEIEAVSINGNNNPRLANTSNISFDFVDGQKLLRSLSRKIAISNGSACNSAAVEPSHVLTAMGVSQSMAMSSVRFSLGRHTTEDHVQKTVKIVKETVEKLRAENILWERREPV
ncbi:cysteine desulfurase family protein [Spongiivirga citrea]|uniref:Aminotransferase class V-fold PLP-dependent enzyme n=1 Tax=Spongiivirga citrea TaxID=1481457 RepID=A0A6M0CLE6_9FLAO|nr:cysteine desulfurase family protein [Spongiivirga citrea]NER18756.1 aminotransferase class V-fold PLP-dependent enzyme [Spongiivirga citrea]